MTEVTPALLADLERLLQQGDDMSIHSLTRQQARADLRWLCGPELIGLLVQRIRELEAAAAEEES